MRQTALITGASSGIGADLARLFAGGGHDLILVARSEGKLRQIAARLEREFGIKAHVVTADLSRSDAAQGIVDAVAARGLQVDILVNNAGYGLAGPFAETDLETELEMIQVNLTALTELTKLFLRPMVARHAGRILNVASTAAFQPGPLMAVYYATKAYVLSFSEAIADELRHSGVTVTVLCPGPTDTGFASVAKMEKSRLFRLMAPMSSAKVAGIGYHALRHGRRMVVAGLSNKLLVASVRVTPRGLVTTIARKLQEGT